MHSGPEVPRGAFPGGLLGPSTPLPCTEGAGRGRGCGSLSRQERRVEQSCVPCSAPRGRTPLGRCVCCSTWRHGREGGTLALQLSAQWAGRREQGHAQWVGRPPAFMAPLASVRGRGRLSEQRIVSREANRDVVPSPPLSPPFKTHSLISQTLANDWLLYPVHREKLGACVPMWRVGAGHSWPCYFFVANK